MLPARSCITRAEQGGDHAIRVSSRALAGSERRGGCARRGPPSFISTLAAWRFTVFSLMPSVLPMAELLRPRAIKRGACSFSPCEFGDFACCGVVPCRFAASRFLAVAVVRCQ